MPYIQGDMRRSDLYPHAAQPPNNKGELNFQITCLLIEYVEYHGMSYDRLSDATAACNDAAVEFDRRIKAPYEDTKILQNGDVYQVLLDMLPELPF